MGAGRFQWLSQCVCRSHLALTRPLNAGQRPWVTPAACVCCPAPALGSGSEPVWHETAPACPVLLLRFSYQGLPVWTRPLLLKCSYEVALGQGRWEGTRRIPTAAEGPSTATIVSPWLLAWAVSVFLLPSPHRPEHRRGPRPAHRCVRHQRCLSGGWVLFSLWPDWHLKGLGVQWMCWAQQEPGSSCQNVHTQAGQEGTPCSGSCTLTCSRRPILKSGPEARP